MTSPARHDYDVVVAGGGIVGAACALAFAQAGLHVALIERDVLGGGATAAGMGHIVVMDDSEAQFALTRRSQQLWHASAKNLRPTAEFEITGTIWVAAEEDELAEAERKHEYLRQRSVPSRMLSARELADLEPNLRAGLAGGLLVSEDAVVYPPVVALHLACELKALGSDVIVGRRIVHLAGGEARLDDGTVLRAPRLVNALGADATTCTPDIPIKKRKGHLVITDRYPGFVRHQLVELGYLKSAHSISADSVAFNVQPRKTGQILIGSSRQYGNEDSAVNQPILSAMLERAKLYMPEIASLNAIRIWTGFRAATPDKLPLIGPVANDSTAWLATGHEGLGITTAFATAELLACAFVGTEAPISVEPYLPSRFDTAQHDQHDSSGDRMNWNGVMPAMTTAFNPDYSIDHGFVGRHAKWLIENGCTGIICLGSLAEAATLSFDEKVAVLRTVAKALNGSAPVVSAISALSTAEAVELAKAAHQEGCSGLMILPQYVYKGDWRENKAHVAAVLQATPLPAMLYNNPVAYGVDFLPAQIAELAAEFSNLAAVKESSTDVRRVTAIRSLLADRLAIFVGVDDAIVEGIAAGAVGWVAGLVNAFPRESVDLFNLARSGSAQQAFELYRWFLPLLRMDTVPKFIQLIKQVQQETGTGCARVRPPRLELDRRELEETIAAVRAAQANRPAIAARSTPFRS